MLTRLMVTRIVFGLALMVVLVGVAPATLTIPITVPPGSAGMAPGIALTDSKQVDNPLVGAWTRGRSHIYLSRYGNGARRMHGLAVRLKSKFRGGTLPTRRSSGPVDAVNSTRNKR